ncbi:general stress protein [Peribacillus sp. B-H-3]|uniref:general stress protein n=1 Tax=Peribacillus sp. B-H-3 TaxID=3400420 RepID=UPI003B02EB3B
MAKSIVGVYESSEETVNAIEGLTSKGYDAGNISVITNREDTDYVEDQTGTVVTSSADDGKQHGSFWDRLKEYFVMDDTPGEESDKFADLNIPRNELDAYSADLKDGKFLLAVDIDAVNDAVVRSAIRNDSAEAGTVNGFGTGNVNTAGTGSLNDSTETASPDGLRTKCVDDFQTDGKRTAGRINNSQTSGLDDSEDTATYNNPRTGKLQNSLVTDNINGMNKEQFHDTAGARRGNDSLGTDYGNNLDGTDDKDKSEREYGYAPNPDTDNKDGFDGEGKRENGLLENDEKNHVTSQRGFGRE